VYIKSSHISAPRISTIATLLNWFHTVPLADPFDKTGALKSNNLKGTASCVRLGALATRPSASPKDAAHLLRLSGPRVLGTRGENGFVARVPDTKPPDKSLRFPISESAVAELAATVR
jgi:hypothetical protein